MEVRSDALATLEHVVSTWLPLHLQLVLLLHGLTVEEPGQIVEGVLEALATHALVTATAELTARDVFALSCKFEKQTK